jgi:hypothetical protein
MSCTITSGIARGCRDNAGGVYQFYVSNFPEGVTGVNDYTTISTEGIITAFDIITHTDISFYEYIPNKNSSNVIENIQSSLENGTVGWEQVLTMVFGKMEASKRNQIKLMASGNLLIVVKDKNGKYWAYGVNDACVISGGNAGTGTGLTDLNGYNLTFTAAENHPAYEVEETALVEALA